MTAVDNDTTEQIDVLSHDIYVEGVPHDQLTRLRHETPVYRHARSEPDQPEHFWFLTRYEDVVRVNRAYEQYSSYRNGCLLYEDRPDLDVARMLIDLDPPEHARLRKLVNRGFTPRAVKSLDGHYREVTGRLIDDAIAAGTVDFVTQLSAELPLIAIAELMGIPVEDRHKVFEWSNAMVGQSDPEYGADPEAGANAMAALYAYAHELAAARKLEPADDIITRLLTAEDDDALSDHEFDLFVLLLAVAGNETTRNAISHGINAFLDNPDQWDLLCEDPKGRLDDAIEEVLRWATPVMHFMRTATIDLEVRGVRINEGDRVVMSYSSANRDEDVFADPFTFDISRNPNPHVAFGGGGPHFCLGAQLARLELRIMFEELASRKVTMTRAGDVERLRSNFINGIKHLPVTLSVD